MGNNLYMGQLVGPFNAKEELYIKIVADAAIPIDYVSHLGIQTKKDTFFFVNNELRQVGKTGMYEIGNTKITSLYFKEDTDNNTIIDYSIVTKDITI